MNIKIPEEKLNQVTSNGLPLGIYLNMPEDAYFAVDAFSYSYSKELQKSPAHAKAYKTKEFKIDPDRQFYKAVHLLTLEESRSADITVVDGTWSPKVKTETILPLLHTGKVVVKSEALERATAMAFSLKENPHLREIFKNGYSEISIFWFESGVYCKCRIDRLSFVNEKICLLDLKSFGDLYSEDLIYWQIRNKFYHHQMALYSLAIRNIFGSLPDQCLWAFCEDEPPHGHKLRSCPGSLLADGYTKMLALIKRHQTCLDFDHWPNYDFATQEIKGEQNENQ